MYIPPNIVPGITVHFAIDTSDSKNDTPDGKNEFHATAQVIIQKSDNCGLQQHLPTNRSAKKFKSDTKFSNIDGEIACIKQNDYRDFDRLWALCQVMDEDISGVLPTWPAFNSLISEKPTISICQGLPLCPFLPTDWSTLYTALRIVEVSGTQTINVEVSGTQKTIVSSLI